MSYVINYYNPLVRTLTYLLTSLMFVMIFSMIGEMEVFLSSSKTRYDFKLAYLFGASTADPPTADPPTACLQARKLPFIWREVAVV